MQGIQRIQQAGRPNRRHKDGTDLGACHRGTRIELSIPSLNDSAPFAMAMTVCERQGKRGAVVRDTAGWRCTAKNRKSWRSMEAGWKKEIGNTKPDREVSGGIRSAGIGVLSAEVKDPHGLMSCPDDVR